MFVVLLNLKSVSKTMFSHKIIVCCIAVLFPDVM